LRSAASAGYGARVFEEGEPVVAGVRVVLGVVEPFRRLGLRVACENAGAAVVNAASSRVELLALAHRHLPQLVIADAGLVDAAVREAAGAPVLLLDDGDWVSAGRELRAGAAGMLPSTTDTDELRAALAAAHAGESVLSPALAQAVLRASRVPGLSPREVQVLRLVARGRQDNQIAAALNISPATVKRHLKLAGEKLETHGRAEAACRAQALGLFPAA